MENNFVWIISDWILIAFTRCLATVLEENIFVVSAYIYFNKGTLATIVFKQFVMTDESFE